VTRLLRTRFILTIFSVMGHDQIGYPNDEHDNKPTHHGADQCHAIHDNI